MKREDAESYGRDCQNYIYKRYHFYFFSHDNLNIINYFKEGFLGLKLTVIVISVFIAVITLLSAFGILLHVPFVKSFLFWTVFFGAQFAIHTVYNYFLYINYVSSSEFAPITTAIASFLVGYSLYNTSPYLAVICVVFIIYFSLRISKAAYWEESNKPPLISDYDKGDE